MKKVLLSVLFLATIVSASAFRMPKNTRCDVCTVYVKADTTVYTKKFMWGADAWKRGKIAFFDTNIVSQDTIDIGTGVKIRQRLCMFTGNAFGYDSTEMDTLCDVCGDSTLSAFVNAEGLSSDSLIMSTIDTTQMGLHALGGDSLWISDGYFVPVTDPAGMIDYEVTGNSDFGSTSKQVIFIFEVFDKVPAGDEN